MSEEQKIYYKGHFAGQLFVVKAGGRLISDDTARTNLMRNVQELVNDGIKVLMIYGGGNAIDYAIHEQGRAPLKINGRRITTKEDIAIVKKVLAGDLSFRILETMAVLDLDGYVFNTVPDHWALYKRRPDYNAIPRFDATIERIHSDSIHDLFEQTDLIITPCLGLLKIGITANVNADNMAIALASGVQAAKLILLTDVNGVQDKDGNILSVLTAQQVEALIEDGTVNGGMQVKMENCVDALCAGVKRIHILNGFQENALHDEVYTSAGAGTMIVREEERKHYEEELVTDKRSAL